MCSEVWVALLSAVLLHCSLVELSYSQAAGGAVCLFLAMWPWEQESIGNKSIWWDEGQLKVAFCSINDFQLIFVETQVGPFEGHCYSYISKATTARSFLRCTNWTLNAFHTTYSQACLNEEASLGPFFFKPSTFGIYFRKKKNISYARDRRGFFKQRHEQQDGKRNQSMKIPLQSLLGS